MNWATIIQDFKNGTLKKKEVLLVIDNDGGYWISSHDHEDTAEKIEKELEEKYGLPGGYDDVVGILRAAGVNAEWC